MYLGFVIIQHSSSFFGKSSYRMNLLLRVPWLQRNRKFAFYLAGRLTLNFSLCLTRFDIARDH